MYIHVVGEKISSKTEQKEKPQKHILAVMPF